MDTCPYHFMITLKECKNTEYATSVKIFQQHLVNNAKKPTTLYQAILRSLIPFMSFNTFFFDSLFQFIKDIIMLFSFLFCHETGKFFLQSLPCHLEN